MERVNGQVLSGRSLMHDLKLESICELSQSDIALKFILREWCTQKLIKYHVECLAVTASYDGKIRSTLKSQQWRKYGIKLTAHWCHILYMHVFKRHLIIWGNILALVFLASTYVWHFGDAAGQEHAHMIRYPPKLSDNPIFLSGHLVSRFKNPSPSHWF